MIPKMEIILVSGRTAKQGVGLEEGKPSTAYVESVNHVLLNPADAEKLGLTETTPVKITTETGSVTVRWVADQKMEPGIVFFPYGPWANQLYTSTTGSTGMPIMKGIRATIEPSDEKVMTLSELVEHLRRG